MSPAAQAPSLTSPVPALPYDVVVVGAGMVGAMILRELSRFRLRVAGIDREPQPGFGVTRAGMSYIHRNHFNPPGSLRARLCRGSQRRFRALADELGVGYREADEIRLAFTPKQEQEVRQILEWAARNGEDSFRVIDREEVTRREPHLSREFRFAIHSPGHGMIHPPEWAFALVESARGNGAEVFLDTEVGSVETLADGGFRVRTDRGDLESRFVVNAAGLQADRIAAMVGDSHVRLYPLRGTFAIFDSSVSGMLSSLVYVAGTDLSYSQAMGPTVHGNLLLGLGHFLPPETRADTRVTREALEDILAMGRQIMPRLPEGEVITTFAGIKTSNNLAEQCDFFVGPARHSARFVHCLISSPGVTAAPGIAARVLDLLSDAGLELAEKPDFAPGLPPRFRFRDAGEQERVKAIGRDPACGHLVCRCERVSEAEVQEVIRRGAGTLDGVKQLTRAGMGRCQGGFCGPRVLTLLASELGLRPDQVTRKGRGSPEVLPWRRAERLEAGS